MCGALLKFEYRGGGHRDFYAAWPFSSTRVGDDRLPPDRPSICAKASGRELGAGSLRPSMTRGSCNGSWRGSKLGWTQASRNGPTMSVGRDVGRGSRRGRWSVARGGRGRRVVSATGEAARSESRRLARRSDPCGDARSMRVTCSSPAPNARRPSDTSSPGFRTPVPGIAAARREPSRPCRSAPAHGEHPRGAVDRGPRGRSRRSAFPTRRPHGRGVGTARHRHRGQHEHHGRGQTPVLRRRCRLMTRRSRTGTTCGAPSRRSRARSD